MTKKKTIHIGTIKPEDLKVRKKSPPPTQVQKSPKDYDRKRLQPHFRRAAEVLDQADTGKGNPAWRNKVRVLYRGPGLKNPAVKSDVQSTIYDALLRNRRLDVEYLPRGKDKTKHYELNPLGLVLKDGLFLCYRNEYGQHLPIQSNKLNRVQLHIL